MYLKSICRLILGLKRLWSGQNPLGSLFCEATVLGSCMHETYFLLTEHEGMGWLVPVYITWRVLAAKIRNGGTKKGG